MPATATAEPPAGESVEGVIAKKPPMRIYFARRADLVLTKRKDRPVRNAEQEVVDVVLGERVAFTEGVLRIPLKGTFPGARGERIDAQEAVRWLEGDGDDVAPHPLLDDRQEGFWLHEEVAPELTSAEQTSLVELAEERNVDGIKAYIAAERAGWAREDILTVASEALERVEARLQRESTSA